MNANTHARIHTHKHPHKPHTHTHTYYGYWCSKLIKQPSYILLQYNSQPLPRLVLRVQSKAGTHYAKHQIAREFGKGLNQVNNINDKFVKLNTHQYNHVAHMPVPILPNIMLPATLLHCYKWVATVAQ